MSILGNRLPPGLAGWVMGDQQRGQQDARKLAQIQGILGIQQAMEAQKMTPLRMQLLQSQVDEQNRLNGILGSFNPSGGPNPAAGGALAQGAAEGDVGPTVTNAARMPAASSNPMQLPPHVIQALLHPKLAPLGKVMAEAHKPTDKVREAISLGMQPGTPQFNSFVGTQFNQGGAWQASPDGGVGIARGYAEGIGEIERAKARAGADFKFEDVPVPGGGTQRMPASRAAQVLGTTPQPFNPPVTPQAMPPQVPSAGMRVSPQVQAQRDAEAAQIKAREGMPNGGGAIPTSSVIGPVGFQASEAQRAADRETATLRAREMAERANNQPKAEQKLAGARQKAQVVAQKVDEALNQTGFFSTGFLGATTGGIPGTPGFNLDRTIDTIKANIGFQELQVMRDNSPTGGALGQVAIQELTMLQAAIASLDKGQSEAQLRQNLMAVKTHFDNWKNVVEQAYQQTYGGPAPAQPNTTAGKVRKFNPATGKIE